MKALDILNNDNIFDESYVSENNYKKLINEAIAELEALENRSCDGCEYDNDSISDSLDYCANCVRSYKDNYKAKE